MSYQNPTADEKIVEFDGQPWLVCAHCGVRMSNAYGLTTYIHGKDCPMGELSPPRRERP